MVETGLAVRGTRPHYSSGDLTYLFLPLLLVAVVVVVVVVALIVQLDVVGGQRSRGVVISKLFIEETLV